MILTKAHAYSFAVDDLFSHTLSYLLFLMSQFNCINSWILNNGNQARNDIAWPTRLLARIIQYSSISCTTRFLVYRAPGSCEILDHYRGFHSHFIPLVTQCDIKPDSLWTNWSTRNSINYHFVYQESTLFSPRLVEEKKFWSMLLIRPKSACLLRVPEALVHQKPCHLLVGESCFIMVPLARPLRKGLGNRTAYENRFQNVNRSA